MIFFYDACAIIYLVEARSPYLARVQTALKGAAQARHAVSALSLLECRVLPLRRKDADALARFDYFFDREDLHIVDLSRAVVDVATRLRADYALKTPDALQVSCALSLGDGVRFVTNDNRLKLVPGLETLRI